MKFRLNPYYLHELRTDTMIPTSLLKKLFLIIRYLLIAADRVFHSQTLSVCCGQEMNSGEVQSSSLHFSRGFMFKRPYSQEKSNFTGWATVHTAGYSVIWEFLQSPFIFPLIHIYFHSLIWNLDFHPESFLTSVLLKFTVASWKPVTMHFNEGIPCSAKENMILTKTDAK